VSYTEYKIKMDCLPAGKQKKTKKNKKKTTVTTKQQQQQQQHDYLDTFLLQF